MRSGGPGRPPGRPRRPPAADLQGRSRRRKGLKRREEIEVEIDALPADGADVRRLLDELRLAPAVRDLRPIGEIRNRRSRHRYAHGLHCLELAWDELEFPAGPPQTRLEVEACTGPAVALLPDAAAELGRLFGERLAEPDRGKVRELCGRLYPELLAA